MPRQAAHGLQDRSCETLEALAGNVNPPLTECNFLGQDSQASVIPWFDFPGSSGFSFVELTSANTAQSYPP